MRVMDDLRAVKSVLLSGSSAFTALESSMVGTLGKPDTVAGLSIGPCCGLQVGIISANGEEKFGKLIARAMGGLVECYLRQARTDTVPSLEDQDVLW